jgi:nicotinate-nucleotide pyrophosphorylase (carboxylating)
MGRLNAGRALESAGLDPDDVAVVVRAALAEDLRFGPDVTSQAVVASGARVEAAVIAREDGVVAGVPVALAVLDCAGEDFEVDVVKADGTRVAAGDVVLTVTGSTRALLRAERTTLNLLSHLSGVATTTRAWVDAVAGTRAVIRDTRKTLPGLRLLQKYAVRCGGGCNHRLGLGDAALIKDNHIAAAGGLRAAVHAVRAAAPNVPLQVECDTVAQVSEALDAGACALLLDNMTIAQLCESVALARAHDGVTVEASGGLALDRAREVAETGVDFLAVGSLTHSARALDLGLDFG